MFKRLMMVLLLVPVMAFSETFVAGKDYEIINGNASSSSNNPVDIKEFFSFGCPWCYQIESGLTQWINHENGSVHFSRIPVVFNNDWNYYAKAYYTADILKIGNKLNPLLFKAVQTDKLSLNSNQAMIDFFIAQGVDKEMAESAFTHSTTIDMKVAEGNQLMGQFHINAVPAIVVANYYKTDLKMAQNEERLFKILDYLMTQVRSGHAAS